MKYTLPKSYANAGLQVDIPEATLKQYRKELGSTKAAVDRWLYENSYMAKTEYAAMTVEKPVQPRKREFKIDEEKAAIIKDVYEWLSRIGHDETITYNDLEITNPNRTITFSLGDNKYELTLVRKKQPK